MKLSIDKVICKFLKISNNTLQMGNGNFVPEFTIPVEGIMLSAEELNTTMGDPLTWRSWYNHSPPALPTPCAWWAHSKGEFPIPDEFEGDWLEVHVSGDRVIEFLADEPTEDKGKKTPAFRISKMVLTPLHGGHTAVKFHLHVRPGLGKENILLQEHQHATVSLSFSETKPASKDSAQGELDLASSKEGAILGSQSSQAATEGSNSPEPETETLGDTKSASSAGPGSEALKGRPGKHSRMEGAGQDVECAPGVLAPPPPLTRVTGFGDEITDAEDPEEDPFNKPPSPDYDKPGKLVSPSGEVIPMRSAAEIDSETAERTRKKLQRQAAALLVGKRNDDLKEFEKGLEAEIKEHGERPAHVINGRK